MPRLRQLLNAETACASYLLGCRARGQFAVVGPHVNLVDDYIAVAEQQGAPIVARVLEHRPSAPPESTISLR